MSGTTGSLMGALNGNGDGMGAFNLGLDRLSKINSERETLAERVQRGDFTPTESGNIFSAPFLSEGAAGTSTTTTSGRGTTSTTTTTTTTKPTTAPANSSSAASTHTVLKAKENEVLSYLDGETSRSSIKKFQEVGQLASDLAQGTQEQANKGFWGKAGDWVMGLFGNSPDAKIDKQAQDFQKAIDGMTNAEYVAFKRYFESNNPYGVKLNDMFDASEGKGSGINSKFMDAYNARNKEAFDWYYDTTK